MPELGSSRVFADDAERREAAQMVEFLERSMPTLGERVAMAGAPELTPDFADLLARVLREIADGHTVTVGSVPPELTTTVAAEQLGVSRTTLMTWVRTGELPSHKVGTHTRVKTADVVALRNRRVRAQRAALEELLALEDAFDIE